MRVNPAENTMGNQIQFRLRTAVSRLTGAEAVAYGLVAGGHPAAKWDEMANAFERLGLNQDDLLAATNGLMDKGLVFEPVLGRFALSEWVA